MEKKQQLLNYLQHLLNVALYSNVPFGVHENSKLAHKELVEFVEQNSGKKHNEK